MARYKILSINKMSSGDTRGLLDMTIQLTDIAKQEILLLDRTILSDSVETEDAGICTENGDYGYANTKYIEDYYGGSKSPLAAEEDNSHIVLNETLRCIDSSTLSDDLRYAIQLTPEWWLSADNVRLSTIHEYNANAKKLHVIFEFEKKYGASLSNKTTMLKDASGTELFPLNDLHDVCIKSLFKKTMMNTSIPGNLVYTNIAYKANGNVDIYADFNAYPIDFCLCNSGAFAITLLTLMQPYMLKSDLEEHMSDGKMHTFLLKQNPIETVLYKTPSQYKKNAKSYEQALSADAKQYADPLCAMSLFDVDTTITGIDYNYVIGIDLMSNRDQAYSNSTIYSNGDIYGSIAIAKNMFNSMYSMQMPNALSLEHCREYCGIQCSLDKVLLKYYDNTKYTFDGTHSGRASEASKSLHAVDSKGNALYPYQKVEYFEPNHTTGTTRHKSNLFSIKIYSSGLDDVSTSAGGTVDKKVADLIKRDIFNGVAALADSIAPANTLLFKVYYLKSFDGEENASS